MTIKLTCINAVFHRCGVNAEVQNHLLRNSRQRSKRSAVIDGQTGLVGTENMESYQPHRLVITMWSVSI